MTASGKVDSDTSYYLRSAFGQIEELDGIELQFVLNDIGYNLAIDGVVGSRTIAAIKEFQNDNSLDDSGEVDEDTLAALVSYFV